MKLSKARLSALVVATTGAGYAMAPNFELTASHGLTMTAACVGTALCAASANTFNQVRGGRALVLIVRMRRHVGGKASLVSLQLTNERTTSKPSPSRAKKKCPSSISGGSVTWTG